MTNSCCIRVCGFRGKTNCGRLSPVAFADVPNADAPRPDAAVLLPTAVARIAAFALLPIAVAPILLAFEFRPTAIAFS